MKPTREQVSDAAYAGDLQLLREYAVQGADLNEIKSGDALLEDVVSALCNDDKAYRYEVVKLLMSLGADPNVLGEDRSGPLVPAMLGMDTDMIRILLEAGADPNKVAGFTEDETLYDWAEFDYRYEVYDLCEPEQPSAEDRQNENTWLQYLDRMAVNHDKRRPDHLFLLRQSGARTAEELKKQTEQANEGQI